MLQPLQYILDNPDDIPMIPVGVTRYLQSNLNAGYIIETGQMGQLKAQGFSEQYILGYLAGCAKACQLIDEAELRLADLRDEEG